MMKRLLDIIAAFSGLLVLSPLLAVVLVLVLRQDYKSPFYIADRAAKGGGSFRMVKIRSMVVGADRSGVESTAGTDARITPIGHFIRRWKLDEVSQLWNVLKGDMSLVGPRPNTLREVAKYSAAERELLAAKPGITDISSIVFSDEGDILHGQADPDAAYDRLIRPWKSRLSLLYVAHSSVLLDLRLIWLTVLAIVSKPRALAGLQDVLHGLNAAPDLIVVAARQRPLADYPTTPL